MKIWKKFGMPMLAGVIVCSSILGFSGCGNADRTASDETEVEDGTTSVMSSSESDATGLTQEALEEPQVEVPLTEPRPSVAPAKMIMGDGTELSPLLYDFWYYNNYDQYIYEIPVDEQGEPDMTALSGRVETETWADTLHSLTMDLIQQGVILKVQAIEDEIVLDEGALQNVEAFFESLTERAETEDLPEDLILQSIYGEYATVESMYEIVEDYFLASIVATAMTEGFEYTDDEVRAYYDENQEMIGDLELPMVRHILISVPEEATDAEDAEAQTVAEGVLARIEAGEDMEKLGEVLEADETAFELAEYTVERGQMVPEFEAWCFDEVREEGDTGIVKTMFGYHVMKLVGFFDQSELVREFLQSNAYNEFMEEASLLPEFAIEVEWD